MKPLPSADLDHVLAHTRPLWDELRGGRIFITGGTGFFGKWLLETFAHANRVLGLCAQAIVLSRKPHPAREAISFIEGDVRTFAFPSSQFSHIIHAATTSSTPVPPDEMLSTTVEGTRRVLDFAAQCGARKLLFTSSGAIYGPQPPELSHMPETFSGAPDTAYGQSKLAAEQLCVQSAIDVKIARCFAFLGPHLPLDAHFAAGNFLRDALAGGPIRVAGDGRPWRSYLHPADLAVWLWTILFRGTPRRAYNVGSDEAVSIAELAQRILPGAAIEIAQRPGDEPAPRYVPDISRARSELGLQVAIGLDDTIRRTLRWLSEP